MPSNLFMGDTEFPKFKEGQSSDEKIDAILDYLRLMQEQLRYTLSHVGDSNINTNDIPGLIKTVNKPVITVVEDSEKKMQSEISQMADSIKLSVENSEKKMQSEISQMADSIELSIDKDGEKISITLSVGEDGKSKIDLDGLVTFTSLEAYDKVTTINGAEINTGTINGVIFNGCQFNCSNEGSGALNFIDEYSNNSVMASMYFTNSDTFNNMLVIATDDNNYGRNNHIKLKSQQRIYLNAEDGIYINDTPIDEYIANFAGNSVAVFG